MITIGVRTSHGQDWPQRIRPPYARSWTSSSPPKWQSTRAVAIWRGKCRRLTHSHSLSLSTLGCIKFTTIAACPRREREKKNELPIVQWSVTYSSSPVQSSLSSAIYSTVQLQLAARSFPLFHLSTWAHCSCDICCHKGLSVVTAFCRFVSFPSCSPPPLPFYSFFRHFYFHFQFAVFTALYCVCGHRGRNVRGRGVDSVWAVNFYNGFWILWHSSRRCLKPQRDMWPKRCFN